VSNVHSDVGFSCINPHRQRMHHRRGQPLLPIRFSEPARGYDLNGAVLPTVTTTTVYDAYGNPDQRARHHSDGYSKTTTNTYATPTPPTGSRAPDRSTVTSVTP